MAPAPLGLKDDALTEGARLVAIIDLYLDLRLPQVSGRTLPSKAECIDQLRKPAGARLHPGEKFHHPV